MIELYDFLNGAASGLAFVFGCWLGRGWGRRDEEKAERLAAAKEREAALRPETIWPSRTSQERGPISLSQVNAAFRNPDVPGYWQERL